MIAHHVITKPTIPHHDALRNARQAYAAQIAFGATRGTAFNFATIAYLQRQPLTSIGAARATLQDSLRVGKSDKRTGKTR
jgi:hypothetical protein